MMKLTPPRQAFLLLVTLSERLLLCGATIRTDGTHAGGNYHYVKLPGPEFLQQNLYIKTALGKKICT